MSLLEPIVGRIVGENADYVRALNDSERRTKSMTDTTAGHFSALGGHITAFAKTAAVGLAGLGAGAAVFLKGAYTEAEEARKTLAQTQAVLKSTGGAAGVTAKDVDSLSNRLSALTGIDDEAVAANENLLLTFTNVRNEAGKGNDVFNQATKATLDMSAALGQDGKESAIQLGKALNDPIKGVTALQRVGVSFTAQQKDQIKTLVESGRTLDAQKIILGEINKEFGGSAEAAASPMAKLSVAFKNLEEQVGTALMPTLATVATFLAEKLPGALSAAGRVMAPVVDFIHNAFAPGRADTTWLDNLVGGVRALVSGFQHASDGITSSGFAGAMEHVGIIAHQVFEFLENNAKPILIGLGVTVALLVAPVLSVAAALIYAYTHFQGLRDVVDAVVGFLVGTVLPAIGAVVGFIAGQFANLVGWVRDNWASISEAVGHAIAFIQAVIQAGVDIVTTLWSVFGDQILAVASAVWSQIQNVIDTVVRIVRDIISVALDIINGNWSDAWHGVMDIVDAAWDYIRNSVGNGVDLVLGVVRGIPGDILRALGGLGNLLWDAGADLLRGMIGGLKSMAGALADAALAPVRGAVDAVKRFLHIGSPSKLFEGFGTNMGEGMVRGIRGSYADVSKAALGMAGAAAVAPGSAAAPAGIAGGSAIAALGGGAAAAAGGGGNTYQLVVQTATGDIPDSTMRKIRSQLFGMTDDLPLGSIVPAA